MPEINVRIEWDWPDDPHWLNAYNLELALSKYCPNTAFDVTDLDPATVKVTGGGTLAGPIPERRPDGRG